MTGRPSRERLSAVQLVVFDVDGVLTDGRLHCSASGEITHAFHVRDGLAFMKAFLARFPVAIISGRHSAGVARRLRELRVTHITQGSANKSGSLLSLCDEVGINPQATAFVGDDVNDLPAMREVGLPVCVADAVPEVKSYLAERGGWVLGTPGGAGAGREVLQAVLEARGLWKPELDQGP
ncbi:MAG: HAD-IIIA family hydrolase [Myxococcota bacterium]